jgi:hypothetical protein
MSFQFSKLNLYQRTHEVPQTGLQTSYANYDDWYYQKGWKTDLGRFTVKPNTVFDKATGLMWKKDFTGSGRKTWAAALAYAKASTLDGYTDWRIPNIKELFTIFDFSFPDIAGERQTFYSVFTPQRAYEEYWSSTTYILDTTKAAEVNGITISFHDKADSTPFTLLVRGGV